RAYDLAALKYWGTTTTTNFPINTYEKEVDEMKHMTRQEYIAYLRRYYC
uniref:AP2/ERF domain-containing protein n=1 Tax=Aegilops tauschii subsp. strangulata TaxID=200361 RepID=A0A453P352_AEGTS